MKKIFLSVILILLATSVFATVDILYVNNITKEYYYSDNGCKGFIGWKNIKTDPSNYENSLSKLIDNGYSPSKFPLKLDIVFLLTISVVISLFIIKKGKGKHSSKPISRN